MKVRELMTAPAIVTTPEAPVGTVARLLAQSGGRGIPVTDEAGRLQGIVTEADLVMKHAHVHGPTYLGILGGVIPFETRRQDEEMRRALGVKASDVMTTKVPSIAPDADVDDAATLMVEGDSRTVVVLENDAVLGTIDQADIVRLLVIEEDAEDGPAPV